MFAQRIHGRHSRFAQGIEGAGKDDRLLVLWRKGLSRGEPGYEARYDVDGNGRIDGSDDDAIGSALGTPIAIP